MGDYRIAVSYQGLDGVAAAMRELADALASAGPRLTGRSLSGGSPVATELGQALLAAGRYAVARAQAGAVELAGQVAASRNTYASHEALTTQQIASGETKL